MIHGILSTYSHLFYFQKLIKTLPSHFSTSRQKHLYLRSSLAGTVYSEGSNDRIQLFPIVKDRPSTVNGRIYKYFVGQLPFHPAFNGELRKQALKMFKKNEESLLNVVQTSG